MTKNSAGKVYYGMHFYPGVAEYADEPGKDPYRIFINEDTIRNMSPTFAGRPIFVEHVDEVEASLDKLKNEADGWVVESFFNPADGKTWAKFIVVSERGDKAIRNGFKLSNAYIPKSFGNGGLWNGVTYSKEVTSGEFEHLAIVRNPRYEESRILTPEQFKEYNQEREVELKRLSNSKDHQKEKSGMLSFFKRAKVENSADLEGMHVILPKSKKEVTIEKLVNDMDEMEMNAGKEMDMKECMANGDHMVSLGEEKMSVNDLIEKHKMMKDELASMKKPAEEKIEEPKANEEKKEPPKEEEKKENEDDADKAKEEPKDEKKKNSEDATHFEALKNAHLKSEVEVAKVELMEDQVARGRQRYGSK